MAVNWNYWVPQFVMLAVLLIGTIVGGLLNATLGFVLMAIAGGCYVGFNFAHEYGTGRGA